MANANLGRYDERKYAHGIHPFLPIDGTRVHNALVTLVSNYIEEGLDPKHIEYYKIDWKFRNSSLSAFTDSDRLFRLLDPQPGMTMITFKVVKRKVIGSGKWATNIPVDQDNPTKWFYYSPHLDMLTDDYNETLFTPGFTEPFSPVEFLEKFEPVRDPVYGTLAAPGSNEVSREAIIKASSLASTTVKFNMNVSTEEANRFGDEFAQYLLEGGMLTPEFIGSANFYSLALRKFSEG